MVSALKYIHFAQSLNHFSASTAWLGWNTWLIVYVRMTDNLILNCVTMYTIFFSSLSLYYSLVALFHGAVSHHCIIVCNSKDFIPPSAVHRFSMFSIPFAQSPNQLLLIVFVFYDAFENVCMQWQCHRYFICAPRTSITFAFCIWNCSEFRRKT